jgi:hypothetical protein
MTTKLFAPLLVFALFLAPGCDDSSGPATTNTSSTAFATLPEKIAFLEEYVSFRRTYEQLEFAVEYQNNSKGPVPGPSDWDVRVIAKVPAEQLSQWIEGLKPVESPDVEWLKTLPQGTDHTGVSVWYRAGGRVVGVDEGNAVVVYRNKSM